MGVDPHGGTKTGVGTRENQPHTTCGASFTPFGTNDAACPRPELIGSAVHSNYGNVGASLHPPVQGLSVIMRLICRGGA
jgi:hypothetical protein